MKRCDKCNVEINTDLNYCPLCFNEIEEGVSDTPKLYSVSTSKPKEIIKNHMTRKIFSIISLAVILTCVIINYLTKTPFWSGIVALGIVYLWILVRHTIMSSRSAFEKVFLQVFGILSILILSNYVSGGDWFVDYVLPSLMSLIIIILNMILFLSPRRKSFEVSFVIIEFFVIVSSIIFMCISTYNLLHLITLCVVGLSFVGLFIMDGKYLVKELTKKFHL